MDRTANWHSHGGWCTLVRGAREGVNTVGLLVHTRSATIDERENVPFFYQV